MQEWTGSLADARLRRYSIRTVTLIGNPAIVFPRIMKTTIFICGIFAFSLTLAAQTKPLLSETFESGSIDPAIWEQKVTGTVSISVVEDSTGHGKRVLKVHYPR